MSNYNSIQTEGHNTYFSAADRLAQDQAESRALQAKMDEAAAYKTELVALIGPDRAARAIAHFGSSKIALETAKAQIASGKCKAA